MSFRLFLYYCALCGGWAAFLAWGVVHLLGRVQSNTLQATLIAGVLGACVAAAVSLVDASLNSSGGQRLARVAVCALLGLAGGALGGCVGQVLQDTWNVPVVVGWVLAGVLIGASLGAFDVARAVSSGQDLRSALRKTLNGVYGGLLGGLVGGLPFSYLAQSTFLPRSSQLVSLVLLGASIGFMIGLAQVVLKEAWVKVEEGFRAGREVFLTKQETTIGRAEGCDLGLFADTTIEKLHARIMVKNNRYVLVHAGEAGQTLLNDRPVGGRPEPLRSGDLIRIGKSVLRFGERRKKKK